MKVWGTTINIAIILRPDLELFFLSFGHHRTIPQLWWKSPRSASDQVDTFVQILCFQRYAATQSWRIITRAPAWRTTPRPANTRTYVPVPRPQQNSRPRISNSRGTKNTNKRRNGRRRHHKKKPRTQVGILSFLFLFLSLIPKNLAIQTNLLGYV